MIRIEVTMVIYAWGRLYDSVVAEDTMYEVTVYSNSVAVVPGRATVFAYESSIIVSIAEFVGRTLPNRA